MFYQLATCPGQDTSNFLYAGDEIGSGRLCEIQDHKVAIAQLCGEHPSDENLIGPSCQGVVVHIKAQPTIEENGDPFIYSQIKDIYVYKDYKIFVLQVIKVVQFVEHFRAFNIQLADMTLLCLYDEFSPRGALHPKYKDGNVYIVDFELRLLNL